jgi:hypothetical protein
MKINEIRRKHVGPADAQSSRDFREVAIVRQPNEARKEKAATTG